MKRAGIKLALFLLVACFSAFAQQSTVTATVTDGDGTAWASLNGYNATYTITLLSDHGNVIPQGRAYRNDTGATITNSQSGNMSSSGGLSVTLVNNNNITPANTTWQIQVCPAVSSPTCLTYNASITGNVSLSTQLSALAIAPRIGGGPGNYAYADVEVAATANNTYYNITTPALRCYSSLWGGCGSGSSLPTAPGAGYAPVSTGAGTTYTAQIVLVPAMEIVAYSATPIFSSSATLSRIVLTGNITSFTLPAGTAGFHKCINFVQGSGSYTVAGPTNVHALFTVGTTSGGNNMQCWDYDTTAAAWLAESTGAINQ